MFPVDDNFREVREVRQGRQPPPRKGGQKMIIRDNANLEDFIEADYNPEKWPYSKTIEFNDKNVIGGDDALEYKGTKKQPLILNLLLTDFGAHRPKTDFKQTTAFKLSWLESRSEKKTYYDEDAGAVVDAPPVLLIERGIETDRVVITKLDYVIELFSSQWNPERARVQITFRKVLVRRKRTGGGNGRNF